MVSSAHAVCAKGLYIAMISTTVETDKPELEIKPALELLGDVIEMFVRVDTVQVPNDDGRADNVRIIRWYNMRSLIVVCDKELRPNLSLRRGQQ